MSLSVKLAIEALRKFDVLDEIPGGANSYAFSAKHRDLQEQRFLKAIYLPANDSDSILNEPRSLLTALNANPVSNNIVKLFDADRIRVGNDDYVLLQMEWLNGSSLQTLLETREFGQQEAVRLTMEILHGVAHLHRQRLVHRDLKPGNILLQKETPKIADFGSVAMIGSGSDFVRASKHSNLYVPSEGWIQQSYTFASDLYQVGLVFYQLVNGPLPVTGKEYLTSNVLKKLKVRNLEYSELDSFDRTEVEKESLAELTAKDKLLTFVSKQRPYVSPAVQRIVLKATRADLNKRFKNAEEFLNKLSQVSTPNWIVHDDTFEACAWRKFDWRVRQIRKKHRTEAIVERKRVGNYKRCHSADDLSAAFRFVEYY